MLDDFNDGSSWSKLSAADKMNYFQNASIYVGNYAENATSNQKCQGSPFLDITDPKNYNIYTFDNANYEPWNYGKEAWCNLEGRYLHVVANLAH